MYQDEELGLIEEPYHFMSTAIGNEYEQSDIAYGSGMLESRDEFKIRSVKCSMTRTVWVERIDYIAYAANLLFNSKKWPNRRQ